MSPLDAIVIKMILSKSRRPPAISIRFNSDSYIYSVKFKKHYTSVEEIVYGSSILQKPKLIVFEVCLGLLTLGEYETTSKSLKLLSFFTAIFIHILGKFPLVFVKNQTFSVLYLSTSTIDYTSYKISEKNIPNHSQCELMDIIFPAICVCIKKNVQIIRISLCTSIPK